MAFALYYARRRRVRFDPERKFAPFWTSVQSSALPNPGSEVAAGGAGELPGPNPPLPARHCAQTLSSADSRSPILDFLSLRAAPRATNNGKQGDC